MNMAQTITFEELEKVNQKLHNKIVYLEEQPEWFKRQIFGKRSEKVVSDLNNPQMLIEGFENLWAVEEDKKKTVVATYSTQTEPKRTR